MGICQVPKIVVGSKNTEQGSIQIYGKDADALILGDATHEGGDVKIYRDASGNLQFSIDADAASNAIAISVYGGVVAQHYLTVGQAMLNTSWTSFVAGTMYASNFYSAGTLFGNAITAYDGNRASFPINILVTTPDATDHAIKLQIDANDIFKVQATGNGSGGIDAATKAIAFFGVTPQVQQSHIIDADGNLADITTKFNTLLADLEGYGLLKSS